METANHRVEDDIPSKYLDRFDSISKESWKHEDFRKRVIEICKEQNRSHDFVESIEQIFEKALKQEAYLNKTKELAKIEITDYVDKSRVKTIFWVVGIVVAGIIGLLLQKAFGIF